ncbi:NUDIX domain-containing protein [Streptomyces sp. NPDC055078]
MNVRRRTGTTSSGGGATNRGGLKPSSSTEHPNTLSSATQVRAGAVLVDERERVLTLRHRQSWAFPEGPPALGDHSLGYTALRVLRECTGIQDAWAIPGAEAPLVIDTDRPDDDSRLRVGFRYLLRAHSGALLSTLSRTGHARWLPLPDIAPRLASRIRPRLAIVP